MSLHTGTRHREPLCLGSHSPFDLCNGAMSCFQNPRPHIRCSLRRQHVPLPLKSPHSKETGHRTIMSAQTQRPYAHACRLRICAVVNTTNPDLIRCHVTGIKHPPPRINTSAPSQNLVTPPRTPRLAARSIPGGSSGICGICVAPPPPKKKKRKEKKESRGCCKCRWSRLRIWSIGSMIP